MCNSAVVKNGDILRRDKRKSIVDTTGDPIWEVGPKLQSNMFIFNH